MSLKPNNDRVMSRIAARIAQITPDDFRRVPLPIGYREQPDGTPVAIFDNGIEISYDFSGEPLHVLRNQMELDPDSAEADELMAMLADTGLQYLQSENPKRLAQKYPEPWREEDRFLPEQDQYSQRPSEEPGLDPEDDMMASEDELEAQGWLRVPCFYNTESGQIAFKVNAGSGWVWRKYSAPF